MAESVVNIHSPNQQSSSLNWIQFNVDYFKTKGGILKLLTLVIKITKIYWENVTVFLATYLDDFKLIYLLT